MHTKIHRKDIDGLRAIAVLAVIINHFDRGVLPNGHLGVDIFFVISGFVITQSLLRRDHSTFRNYIFGFYERRIKRLVPALFVCITVTLVIVFLIVSPDYPLSRVVVRTGQAALFGLSNLYLLRQATDYFGSSAELNPFTHTWSLGVEEQFYLLFPVLLWFSGLLKQSNQPQNFTKFYLVIGLPTVVSFVAYIWLSQTSPVTAFYLMPTRFWELTFGAFVSVALLKVQNSTSHKLASQVALPSLIALIALLFTPPQVEIYNSLLTVAVVFLTTVLIFGIRPTSFGYKILTLNPLVFLGIISYSLYLWHWSVLTISRWTIGLNSWTIPFQLITILLLSVLSYYYIEKPLRHSDWRKVKINGFQTREIGHVVFFALSTALLIVLVATPLHRLGYLYSGTPAPLIKQGVETLRDKFVYNDYSWEPQQCVLLSNDDVGKLIQHKACTFGEFQTGKRRFFVIGDSFSVAQLELYKVLAQEYGSVTLVAAWGASAVPELENASPWSEANSYYWNFVIPNLFSALQAGDVLILINDGVNFSPKKHNEISKKRVMTLQDGLTRIAEEMSQRGVFVIYQSGNPFMREASCTLNMAVPQWWHVMNEPPCTYYTRTESLERRELYHNALLQIQHQVENFAVLDLFDLFCPNNFCRYYNDDGVFLYRDEWSHPSVEANHLAQPFLIKTIDQLLAQQEE